MKNTIRLSSLFILIFGLATASQAQIGFGVKAGLNAYTLNQSGEDIVESSLKSLNGFHIGAVVSYQLDESLSLTTGLTFITKGTRVNLDEEFAEAISFEGSSFIKLNYLEIPLHINYQKNNFHVFGGPYVAFGLSGKFVDDYTINFNGVEFVEDNEIILNPAFGSVVRSELAEDEDAFNALDVGLNLGVGYQAGPVFISLDYSYGFGNVVPTYENESPDDDKLSNAGFKLSGTYMF